MILRRSVMAAGAGGAIMPRSLAAAGPRFTLDLSGVPLGGLPDGVVIARTGVGIPAEWVVRDDASVPGGRVLTQISTERTDYRFPLAIFDNVVGTDVDVSVRFKAIAGRGDRAGGLAIRLLDRDHYYVVRANALEDNVNFYRVIKGDRQEIKGASAKVASDAWHSLGLRSVGDKFTISFNGKSLFTVADRTFPAAGRIALWTKADSITAFTALTVR